MPTTGLKLRLDRITYALASVATSGLQLWHKMIASAWSGSNRMPDTSGNSNTGAMNTGRGLDFDGVNDLVDMGNPGISCKTIVFYCNPDTTTQSILHLTAAISVSISAGTLAATGWTSPTRYVNGAASSTVAATNWQQIAITSATGFTVNDMELGRISSTYFAGMLSNVKIFSVELSAAQVAELYANPEQVIPTGVSSSDLVGWWMLSEGAGSHALNSVAAGVGGSISGATAVTAIGGAASQWALGGKSLPMLFGGYSSGDYVEVPDAASLDFASTDNFTIAALVYIPVLDASAPSAILSKYNASSNQFVFACRKDTYNGFLFRTLNQDHFPPTDIIASIEGKVVLVACRRNGSVFDFFVNGTKHTSATPYTDYSLTNAVTLKIGVWDNIGNHIWNGFIFWAAIWRTNVLDSDISAMAAGTSTPNQINSIDLRGYWRNRGATTAGWVDESGNANNASAVNGSPATVVLPQGLTAGKDVTGLVALQYTNSGSLLLNGDGYDTATDAASLDITTNITLEAWVKPFQVTATQTIIGKNGAYALKINSSGKPSFSKWTSTSESATATTSTTLAVNTWQLISITYDGANVKIYVGGVLNTTTSVTGAMDTNASNVLVGALTTSTELFSGYIDSVKIYNTVKTAAEILGNFNAELSEHQ